MIYKFINQDEEEGESEEGSEENSEKQDGESEEGSEKDSCGCGTPDCDTCE